MKFPKAANKNVCPACESKRGKGTGVDEPCPACLMKLGMQSWQENQSLQQFSLEPTMAAGNSVPTSALSAEMLAKKFPQYELMHLVGAGGMGTVYCARQTSLNRLVALKVIKPEANQRAEFADRFIREARAMAQMNHPNIITVHDFGEIDGIYFFVMEYVDGVNLRQMLRSHKLTTRQALEIVPAVCDALQYAHDSGVVHRDIKPENILIDTTGKVKIADFGLAKLLDQDTPVTQLTRANHVMGTMHYMAPEQIETPLAVDHRADIYSLGVVIYELLTGELPLGRFAPPSHKVSIDVRLDEIVLQTLAKEPGLRYQRVSDVRSELDMVSNSPQPATQHANARDAAGFGESPIPAQHAAARVPVRGKPPVVARTEGIAPLNGPVPGCGAVASIFHPRTWLNAWYLILALPLGILYFVLTIVGLSVGFSTLIVWIGIPILLLTFAGIRSMAFFDRKLVRHMLNTNIPVVKYKQIDDSRHALAKLRDFAFSGDTWKPALYLLSKLVVGVISFPFSIVLVTLPLAAIFSPIAVMFLEADMGVFFIDDDMIAAIFMSFVGLVIAPWCAWGINRLAWLNAEWAKVCLSRN